MAIKVASFIRRTAERTRKHRGRPARHTELLEQILQAAPSDPPRFVEPMKCKLVHNLSGAGDWLYELKLDGDRAIAIKHGRVVKLMSKTRKDLSAAYPELVASLRKLKCKSAVLDGEIVVLDQSGKPSSESLENLGSEAGERRRLFYFAFDIMNYNGHRLMQLPFEDRKYVLQCLADVPPAHVRFVRALKGTSDEVVRRVCEQGLEGIVAKARLSRYEPGQRTGAWLKYNNPLLEIPGHRQ